MNRTGPSSPFSSLWQLDSSVCYLNHGSFGATPTAVLKMQQDWRTRMEAQPVLFLDRELEAALDNSRTRLATVLNCDAPDLAFLPNATTAVNTVLRSLPFRKGDEILFCSHGYNACRNAIMEVCAATGARPVCVHLPYPAADSDSLFAPWLEAITPHTRFALIDHITSPTALVLPVERLVPALQNLGVSVMVDGAHAPGQLPLDLRTLNADYYTGNCHKWLCSPKGSAFLHVNPGLQPLIRPLVISHGANSLRTDRSRFHIEFDWLGTVDPTPYLGVGDAIDYLKSIMPLDQRMQHNHDLVVAGRSVVLKALGQPAPCPESLLGAMAAIPLPAHLSIKEDPSQRHDPLATWLWNEHRIEVPIIPRQQPPTRLIRISAQLYNSIEDYQVLANALSGLL